MTSLSLDDINTQGATIGFYPDDALSWSYQVTGTSASGEGVCNNTNYDTPNTVCGQFNSFKSAGGNEGYYRRQTLINFDTVGIVAGNSASSVYYGNLVAGGLPAGGISAVSATNLATAPTGSTTFNNVWKSYISAKVAPTVGSTLGYIQYSVVATIYLKHIHSFFNMCPLLKGVFMKMTMNLNNTSSTVVATTANPNAGAYTVFTAGSVLSLTCSSVSNPLGGVNPLMVSSGLIPTGVTSALSCNGGIPMFSGATSTGAAGAVSNTLIHNISVGATCLDNTIRGLVPALGLGQLSKSIYLYVPAYTFNPVFEQAYLSSPVKSIKYTDVYQYQVINQASNQPFTQLLTNGIANVKSVLVLPFYNSANNGIASGIPSFQSPFDPAGTGPTSPLCGITNFNIQVSGQNAIYNMERYNFEQFNNQLYGQNAVNGGLTDGITSGLIDRQKFDMEYCYYYVNVERMLPVEHSVPKSIQLLGQNTSSLRVDYYCFIEYGNEISIDILTGARV
jgi:hypothetical protein